MAKVRVAVNFLLLTITSILVFSYIYRKYDKLSHIDAYYHSALIQTLIGAEYKPKSFVGKLATIFQALISYLITGGVILGDGMFGYLNLV